MNELGKIKEMFNDFAGNSVHPLSFGGSDLGLESWKEKGRAKVKELLCCPTYKNELEYKILSRTRIDNLTQIEIELTVCDGFKPKGTLLLPIDNGPHPAVIAMHCHGGFYYYGKEKVMPSCVQSNVLEEYRQKCYSGITWGKSLAERGFAVLCMDAFYFGSGSIDGKKKKTSPEDEEIIDYNIKHIALESLTEKYCLAAGYTWPGILLLEDLKSIDFLQSMPEIDSERIGCCGLSGGGLRSAFLAGMDDRIKCSVVSAWMTKYASLIPEKLSHTFMAFVPGLTRYMDLPDVAAVTAPNALFVQQCKRDTLFTQEGMMDACKELEKSFRRAGVPDNFVYKFYDNGHEFNKLMQDDAFRWLEKWLKS